MGQNAPGGMIQEPGSGVPTGYQPPHTADKAFSSTSVVKADDGLWPSDQNQRPPEKHVNFSSNFSDQQSSYPPAPLPSFPSATDRSIFEASSRGGGGNSIMSSMKSDRDSHHLGSHPGGGGVHFSPSLDAPLPGLGAPATRVPSNHTDIDGYAPPRSFDPRLSGNNHRLDSFTSDISYAPSASGGRPCYGSPASIAGSIAGSVLDDNPSSGRESWREGSIIEVFSASTNRWYAAQLVEVKWQDGQEVLTVLFYVGDEAKQKSVYRTDKALTSLGEHTIGELPPGFETRPSQSRPGQLVYLDATTGTKYASPELAWRLHFERMQQRSPDGCQTVACIQAVQQRAKEVSAAPSPMKALTLAELNGLGVAERGGGPNRNPNSGKVNLPSFGTSGPGDQQAAYLGFMGTPGAAAGLGVEQGYQGQPADYPSAMGGEYPSIRASAPRRPIKTREISPQLSAWQEDPFSEWRR
eukprot:TRINITY_DN70638_c0_g1_i1.p1 TRINITY_DN70638_c0_g1~~TRINITY_DN70638_c0_g1_i1.p1  ORF type:complete len:467 (-),score=75.59 TRINITY_DN70638_c0_g1_i1:93-1493(-)